MMELFKIDGHDSPHGSSKKPYHLGGFPYDDGIKIVQLHGRTGFGFNAVTAGCCNRS